MAESDRITRGASSLRRRWMLAAALTAAVVAVAGCSDDSSTPSSMTSDPDQRVTADSTMSSSVSESTSSTSETPVGETLNDEIIARYVGYWDARFAANSGTPNPDAEGLREYATGAQLDAVVAETQSNLDQGLAFRKATNPANFQRVNVVEVDGDHAVVQECVVSDGVIVRRDTGEVVDDDVATHNVRGELVRVDGEWRVSTAQLVQRWEGVAGCASDS